jgi:hypothetical protein
MWERREYISKAQPVTLEQLLRENSWIIRKNEYWEKASNLEALKNTFVTLAKIYTSREKKGKSPKQTVHDIAIAEIKEVQWSKDKGVAISAKLLATTKPIDTELDATILLAPPIAGLDWMARVSLADFAQFTTVLRTRSLTCLVFEVGRKADTLFSKFLKEEAQRDSASTAPIDPLGEELRNSNLSTE